mmetsp:Transcript_23072/g.50627  ORF Transcript_23072/g.50627 Transcript_23072/m.50627 type:complete len:148 (-) Transcript_23072:188-631(-)|eukprot:CAMPEP_0202893816 /NCGR_PEP_ID=MMETSP1392-20130828/3307_1 /ASSEMBLY_ACC=CAM_ASM_000868 /TAXON_ID=225041 /ORGANISM="Chlamydomonas chlamydogama, Strain SAG 11-48b" /LENGTH=147 /DNA_ID=CAMNT_0049578283 /DNA_START=322 /DNA_END=765 /DNA_ORIENTATION=+
MKNIETEVIINAPPQKVWKAFVDFDNLPQWQSWLTVRASPEVKSGQTIDILLKPEGTKTPMQFKPTVLTSEPGSEFRWRGRLWNTDTFFVGEHYFRFTPEQGGKATKLVHGEVFKGWLVPLLGGTISQAHKEFERFNQGLKKQVESN